MMQFHPNIIRIKTAFVNNYLIRNGNRSVLIDTGIDISGHRILQAIQSYGLQPSDIRLIILTHAHYDHCKGAAAIKVATGADLLVHKSHEMHLRRGHCRLPRGTSFPVEAWVTLGRIFMPWLSHFRPVEPEVVITQNFDLQYLGLEAKIIHTPGHTDGSLTVILEGKHALVGDTCVGPRGKSVYPPFADDPKTLLQSWKKLLGEGVECLYPGHGSPFGIERLMEDTRW